MKKHPLLLSLLLIVACGQGPTADQQAVVADRTVQEVQISEGEPMAKADLTITGMSCSMMCGNMIKSALAKVPGVSAAEVEYTEGTDAGHAKVTYDPAKVDDGQLVSAVRALADGQYGVTAISIVKEVKAGSPSAHLGNQKRDKETASLIPEVHMPNLVGMLMALVRI